MRLAGKQKLGYFPLPLAEAERIRRFLQLPLSRYAALDPCIGDAFDALGIDGGKGIVVGEGGGQRTDFRVTAYDRDQVCLAVLTNPGAQMDPDVRPCFLGAPQVNQLSKSFMRIFHRLSLSPPFP